MRYLWPVIALILNGCYVEKQKIDIPKYPQQKERSQKWWRVFKSEELNALISESLKNSYDIKYYSQKIIEYRYLYKNSLSSLYPSVSASMKSNYYKDSESFVDENLEGSITFKYELDLFKKLSDKTKKSLFSFKSTKEELKSAKILISGEIAKNYIYLSYEKENEKLLEKKRELALKKLDFLKRNYISKEAKISQIINQKTALEDIEYRLKTAKIYQNIYLNSLKTLLSKDIEDSLFVKADFLKTDIKIPDISVSQIAQRPDIKSLYLRLISQDYSYGAAIKEQYPSFSITSSISSDIKNISKLFDNWYLSASAAINAIIFDKEAKKNAAKAEEHKTKQLLYQYKQALLEATKEAAEIRKKIEDQKRYLYYLNQKIQNDKRELKVEKKAYLAGESNLYNLLDYEIRVIDDINSILKAKRDLLLLIVDFYKATTSGWQKDES